MLRSELDASNQTGTGTDTDNFLKYRNHSAVDAKDLAVDKVGGA
jgi:hypothetical protein